MIEIIGNYTFYRLFKEAHRQPPHATGTLFSSRNQYTPTAIVSEEEFFRMEGGDSVLMVSVLSIFPR